MGRTADRLDIFSAPTHCAWFQRRESVALLRFRLVLSSERRKALQSHLKATEGRSDPVATGSQVSRRTKASEVLAVTLVTMR